MIYYEQYTPDLWQFNLNSEIIYMNRYNLIIFTLLNRKKLVYNF